MDGRLKPHGKTRGSASGGRTAAAVQDGTPSVGWAKGLTQVGASLRDYSPGVPSVSGAATPASERGPRAKDADLAAGAT